MFFVSISPIIPIQTPIINSFRQMFRPDNLTGLFLGNHYLLFYLFLTILMIFDLNGCGGKKSFSVITSISVIKKYWV